MYLKFQGMRAQHALQYVTIVVEVTGFLSLDLFGVYAFGNFA